VVQNAGLEMNKREQSHAEWEQELQEMQQNLTSAQAQRTAHSMAKQGYTAPVEDLTHFVELLSAGILLTLGISALSSGIAHSTEIAVAALAAGCYLGWTGFRWNP
jgi:hypothetical protein